MRKIILCFLTALLSAPCCHAFFFSKSSAPKHADWNKELYTLYLKAVIAEKDDNKDEAYYYYKKALDLAPESDLLREDVVAMAIDLKKTSEIHAYAKSLPEAGTATAYATYAMYNWVTGEIAEADKYFEKSLEIDPLNTAVLTEYLNLLSTIDFDRAVKYMESYAVRVPDLAPYTYQEIGNAYLKEGKPEPALEAYAKSKEILPIYAQPYLSRAEIYEKTRRLPEALKEYKEMEELGLADSKVYNRIGSINVLLGNIKEAKKIFLAVKAKNNSDQLANQFLAVIAEDEKNYAKAIEYLQDAEDFKTNSERQRQAAVYASKLGDKKEAARLLKKAYESSGSSVEMGYYYAISLQDMNNHEEAAEVFEDILSQSPDYNRARLMYAFSLDSLKRDTEFEKQMQIFMTQHPENPTALNMYAYFLAERQKDLDKAKQYASAALLKEPKEPAYLDTMGWILFRQGDYDSALSYLLQAGDLLKDDPEMSAHIAIVYLAKGDKKNADKYLSKTTKQFKEKYKAEIEKFSSNML
ncbi:Tetratricopeptide repeat-containing protein [Parelusimicrobium proximum]|uniref:tetratricopeptide repeat protein n=1 Tax=Parelusimicrobium proximum TaxID=3228953 RepID=UPI003D1831F7